MGKGLITRRGGVGGSQTAQPTITFISSTTTSITFTITNNEASTATIVYRVNFQTADGNSISLSSGEISSNLTVSGLVEGDIVIVYATANTVGGIKSNVAQIQRGITLAAPTIIPVSQTTDSITFAIRNESNTATSLAYGLTSPPTIILELAANTTSANQTISDLNENTSYTVFSEATKNNYTNSDITSLLLTTDSESSAINPLTFQHVPSLSGNVWNTQTNVGGMSIKFSHDGLRLSYMRGYYPRTVYWTSTELTTPFNANTKVNTLGEIQFNSPSSGNGYITRLTFSPDGTKLFGNGYTNANSTGTNAVHQWTLTTPFDMRTVSNQIVIVPPGVLQEGTAGIDISEDGQYLFYIHWVKPHTITTFQMATPFEINSGLTLVRTTVIPDSTTTGFPIWGLNDFAFHDNGHQLLVKFFTSSNSSTTSFVQPTRHVIRFYNLTEAYNLSTINTPQDVFINTTGSGGTNTPITGDAGTLSTIPGQKYVMINGGGTNAPIWVFEGV